MPYPVARDVQQLVEQTALSGSRFTHQTHKAHRFLDGRDDRQRLIVYLYLSRGQDA
jgi:hypothetical protein